MELIDKSALVAEIEKRQSIVLDPLNNNIHTKRLEETYKSILSFLDTLEVKESLTWEDIRELYITFAEVDAEIEFCKCDIQAETIGYYQEVLKRFKAQKGE